METRGPPRCPNCGRSAFFTIRGGEGGFLGDMLVGTAQAFFFLLWSADLLVAQGGVRVANWGAVLGLLVAVAYTVGAFRTAYRQRWPRATLSGFALGAAYVLGLTLLTLLGLSVSGVR